MAGARPLLTGLIEKCTSPRARSNKSDEIVLGRTAGNGEFRLVAKQL